MEPAVLAPILWRLLASIVVLLIAAALTWGVSRPGGITEQIALWTLRVGAVFLVVWALAFIWLGL